MANKSFNARHGISVGPNNIEFIDSTGQILAGTRISFLTNPTITTDQPLFNATQTWNNAATPFNALKINITDTASNASSRLLDLQKGGVSQFYVDKSGNVVVLGDLTVQGTTVTMNTSVVDVEDTNITLGKVASPSNVTADGGGITLLGSTNKTIIWDSANTNWTSSEHFNLLTGKVYKINNVQVLSNTALGSTVVSSSLTSVGTIGTGVWQGTPIANTYIANPQITVGTTTIALGASSTTLAGLTSVTSTSFVGALTGNASSASTVALTADNATNATRYPLFASAATGNLSPLTDTGFTYNPSTGVLTSVSFAGSGASLTSLNASNLASGIVPDARISGSYTGMTNLTGSGNVDFAKFLGNVADTVSAPSFSWTGDTNTGIYRPAADQIGFAIGGVQRGLFSAAGLTVTGDVSTTNALLLMTAGSAIQMDTAGVSGTGFKKITLNDGGGNWNFRGGVYYSGGVKYETTGNGATNMSLNFEGQDGNILLTVYPIGTAGAIATPSTTLNLHTSGLTLTGGNFIGDLTGNATTATTLQTARTINGVSFNGSANIVIEDSTKLPFTNGSNSIDANTYTDNGVIGVAAASTNIPSAVRGTLFYNKETNANNLTQLFQTIQGSNELYIRRRYGAAWSAWDRLLKESEVGTTVPALAHTHDTLSITGKAVGLSASAPAWVVADFHSNTTESAIRLYNNAATHVGTYYGDSAGNQGFLNTSNSWSLRVSSIGDVIATAGLYGTHLFGRLYPTSAAFSHTDLRIGAAKAGYYGLGFGPDATSTPRMMFDGNGNGGLYVQSWNWIMYHTASNRYTGFNGPVTAPSFLGNGSGITGTFCATGQAWRNSPSPSGNNVTYTNSYGHAIMGIVYSPVNTALYVYIDGIQIFNSYGPMTFCQFVVPPGSSYRAYSPSGLSLYYTYW